MVTEPATYEQNPTKSFLYIDATLNDCNTLMARSVAV